MNDATIPRAERVRAAVLAFGSIALYVIVLAIVILAAPLYELPYYGTSTAGGTTRISAAIVLAVAVASWGAYATVAAIAVIRWALRRGNSRLIWPLALTIACFSGTITITSLRVMDFLANGPQLRWRRLLDSDITLVQQVLLAGVMIGLEWLTVELLVGWGWRKLPIIGILAVKAGAVAALVVFTFVVL